MRILKIYPSNINRNYIDDAVDALRQGAIILYPTDTYYALGCDALNNRAIEGVCRLKGINPNKQTLSVVCADISQAAVYARIDNRAFALLKHNLPGPFTFLLPAATTLPKVFKGRKTVGIRIPDNPISRALAEELGHPILSATASTEPDATPEQVALLWEGRATMIIDGGDGADDASTIIDLTDSSTPETVRQGRGIFEE